MKTRLCHDHIIKGKPVSLINPSKFKCRSAESLSSFDQRSTLDNLLNPEKRALSQISLSATLVHLEISQIPIPIYSLPVLCNSLKKHQLVGVANVIQKPMYLIKRNYNDMNLSQVWTYQKQLMINLASVEMHFQLLRTNKLMNSS